MPDDIMDNVSTRSPVDFVHFALVSLGIVLALTGVVLASIRIVLCGLVLVAWGLAYFYPEPD